MKYYKLFMNIVWIAVFLIALVKILIFDLEFVRILENVIIILSSIIILSLVNKDVIIKKWK